MALIDRFGSQVAVGQPRVDFVTGTAGIGHFWTSAPVNRTPESRHSTMMGRRSPYFRDLAPGGYRLERSQYQRLATRFQEDVKFFDV